MTPEELAAELQAAPRGLEKVVFNVVEDAADDIARVWAADAATTVRPHAKYYPASITATTRMTGASTVEAAIGPEEGTTQGFLGRVLELGGAHSPAFLHGLRAVEAAAPKLVRIATQEIEETIP